MKIYKGVSASGGVAIGNIVLLKREESVDLVEKKIDTADADSEEKRVYEAIERAERELSELYDRARKSVSEEIADIFVSHKMMLADSDFVDGIISTIKNERANAEYAVYKTVEMFASLLSDSADEYMRERADDIRDVGKRLRRILRGGTSSVGEVFEKSIIVAEDISPTDTAMLDRERVIGVVTKKGSPTSHASVLARGMGIPAAVGIEVHDIVGDGALCVLDGEMGILYVSPTPEIIAEYEEKIREQSRRRRELLSLFGKENITRCGRRIELFANVGSVSETLIARENDASGIGLFRSEFIFSGKSLPSEEEQLLIYRRILEIMEGKTVIIRMLDIGADKKSESIPIEDEENPALGVRGIRLLLEREELFKSQARALLRASLYGELWVMVPMITLTSEMKRARELFEGERESLLKSGYKVNVVKFGMMVETPAAAICISDFDEYSDFYSIGSNDLAQYTLAMDRMNPAAQKNSGAREKAVMLLIKHICDSSRRAGKWVGICGELASDTDMTEELIRLGVSELSVSPSMILSVRAKIRETEIKTAISDNI